MKAYKFRIYPNKLQETELNKHRWISKNLWNDLLAHCKETYKQTGKFPRKSELQSMTKNKGLYSQTAQVISHRLYNSMRRYFIEKKKGKDIGFPRFRNFDRVKSIYYPQSGFKLKDKLKVSPFGEIKIKQHRPINGTVKTLAIKREPSGKWYAIFTVMSEPQIPKINNGSQIGIDLGLKTFAVTSEGDEINNPRHIKKYEKKLAFRQRRFSRKKLDSKNGRKEKVKVAKVYEKMANSRTDFLHKLSNQFTNNYSLIAMERLACKDMAQKNYGKQINDAGWGMFANMMDYKAENAGSHVVFVNPKNTTKECHKCGHIQDMPLSERIYYCPECKTVMDRDVNAAINILRKATTGIVGSNACGDGNNVLSVKQEATV